MMTDEKMIDERDEHHKNVAACEGDKCEPRKCMLPECLSPVMCESTKQCQARIAFGRAT
jgi:hypothetical protein